MNNAQIFDYIRNNGLTKHGTYDTGVFRPIKNKSGVVYVSHKGKMTKASTLVDQFPFLRNVTGLPEDSTEMVVKKVTGYVKQRTSAYADIVNAGLILPVNDAGVMVYSQPKHSGMSDAVKNMTGMSNLTNEEFKFDVDQTPLPVIVKDIKSSWRLIAAMKRGGFDFVSSGVQEATESVLRRLESDVFIDEFAFGGATAYGYTNSGNRQTGSLTYDWSAAATTAANIWADILLIDASIRTNLVNPEAGKAFGYVPMGYMTHFNDVFSSGDRQTLGEKIKTLSWVNEFKEVSYQKAGNVVVAFMQPMYVNMVRGAGIQPIIYNSPDGLETHIKVMAIESPLITDDYNGKKGVFDFVKS